MVGVRDRLTPGVGEAEGAAVRRALVLFHLDHLDDVRDARVPAVGRRAAAGRRLVGCLCAGGAEQGRRCQAPHAAPTRIDAELDTEAAPKRVPVDLEFGPIYLH